MTGYPGFGVLLAKLSDRRQLDIGALTRRTGVSEPEIQDVLGGAVPTPSLLRKVGPALGLHAEDIFVFAGVTVPDDLAPLDAGARRWVPYVVEHAERMRYRPRLVEGLVAKTRLDLEPP
ncbi:hypothetical protein [Streptomyces sp. NBC_01236]|uniref:hypothetical protein n=1 Tax=Streptomyces sp. NBC_01236 TaxID=2903789 RepID=UPI002E0D839F|nr:hypothetical protein OG324_01865 [Streptomyces sp. NBC_01236]